VSQSELSLDEVVPVAMPLRGRRRRRRPQLIVDTETRLSRQQINARMQDTQPTLRRLVRSHYHGQYHCHLPLVG